MDGFATNLHSNRDNIHMFGPNLCQIFWHQLRNFDSVGPVGGQNLQFPIDKANTLIRYINLTSKYMQLIALGLLTLARR